MSHTFKKKVHNAAIHSSISIATAPTGRTEKKTRNEVLIATDPGLSQTNSVPGVNGRGGGGMRGVLCASKAGR